MGQDGCGAWTRDRTDKGQDGHVTDTGQDRTDMDQDRHGTDMGQDRTDTGQDGHRTGRTPDRGRTRDRMDTGQDRTEDRRGPGCRDPGEFRSGSPQGSPPPGGWAWCPRPRLLPTVVALSATVEARAPPVHGGDSRASRALAPLGRPTLITVLLPSLPVSKVLGSRGYSCGR